MGWNTCSIHNQQKMPLSNSSCLATHRDLCGSQQGISWEQLWESLSSGHNGRTQAEKESKEGKKLWSQIEGICALREGLPQAAASRVFDLSLSDRLARPTAHLRPAPLAFCQHGTHVKSQLKAAKSQDSAKTWHERHPFLLPATPSSSRTQQHN